MVMPSPQLRNAYSPYVLLPGLGSLAEEDSNNSLLLSVLADKTVRQIDLLINYIEQERWDNLPQVVASMALENPHIIQTILNMLLAYRQFLSSHNHADVREKLAVVFLPMEAWVQGQCCVTTPALLVVQSILLSHCEWFRSELFESFSAIRAYEELETLGYPEEHRKFIAGIIAHQTLLRAAWSGDSQSDPRESLGFYQVADTLKNSAPATSGKTFKFAEQSEQNQVLGLALAETLFRFIDGPHQRREVNRPNMLCRQLAGSLVLHALCLQCRHSRHAAQSLPENIKEQALGFFDYLLAIENNHFFPNAGLVFLHYGRHVYQAHQQAGIPDGDNLYCQALAWIQERIPRLLEIAGGRNISFCFQRVSSKKIWHEIKAIGPEVEDRPEIWHADDEVSKHDGVHALVMQTVGSKYFIKRIGNTDYLLTSLGLDLTLHNISEIQAWASNKPMLSNSKLQFC